MKHKLKLDWIERETTPITTATPALSYSGGCDGNGHGQLLYSGDKGKPGRTLHALFSSPS